MRRLAPLVAIALLFLGVPRAPAAPDGTRGKMAGVMLVTPQSGQDLIGAEATRVKELGANTAGITVYWETTDDQNGVRREQVSIDDAALRASIRTARDAGLEIALHLMLHCSTCPTHWRGEIDPSDPQAFFRSYRAMVTRYAQVAEQEGVKRLFIGSEMTQVQPYAEEWRKTAAAAREWFTGIIVYEVNWDTTDSVKFWDAVDEVGVSAYFPLSDRRSPTVADLLAGWKAPRPRQGGPSWFERIKALSEKTGKKVVFGEVGYRSTDTAATRPWDPFASGSYDAQAQANLYQALLQTFEPESWWAGVAWWEWYLPRSSTDGGYTPRDKQGENLLRSWWGSGIRPAPGKVTAGGALITEADGRNAEPSTRALAGGRSAQATPRPGATTTTAGTATSSVGATARGDDGSSAAALGGAKASARSDGPGGAGVVAGALLVLTPIVLVASLLLRRVRSKAAGAAPAHD